MNETGKVFLDATITVFLQQKKMADQALVQLENDAEFFHIFGPRSHSIAVTVKHVSGNLRSRWSDFLNSDGEKSERNREGEFLILQNDTRGALMSGWNDAWKVLIDTLEGLGNGDLEKTVFIRKEPHSVPLAIQRSLAHTSYHVGQILYLSRLIKSGDWSWLTIAPGASGDFNRNMEKKFS